MVSAGAPSAAARADERKALELSFQVAVRNEKQAKREMKELEAAAKEHDEQLSSLKDRVAAVTSELSQLKLNSSLAEALVEQNAMGTAEADPNLEVTTFREVSGAVNTAFRQALKARLADSDFVERLSDTGGESRPEFCQVLWGEESADWKVHDPRDGTEVSFGALLQDVSRYWGLDHTEMVLTDASGACWPLEMYVWDELGATRNACVTLARRPQVEQLEQLEYDYDEDEDMLPIHIKRRRDRERRAKQVERHTKESIRKQKARDRAEVFQELIKYVCMMLLYFIVLLNRRDVRAAYLLTDSVRTAFVEENFGDANAKAFEDIRTYGEFFDWARGPFTEGLVPSEYYDGSEIPLEKRGVMYYNKLVGGLRMRQVKVTPNEGCSIATNVQTSFTPTKGVTAGIKQTRKYVQKCYSNYKAGSTWKRAPFAVMQQTFDNFTGPEHCRTHGPWNGNEYANALLDDYDTYQRCLGTAFYDRGLLIDPETGEQNVTDPLKLAFTWRDAIENDLGKQKTRGRFSLYDGSGYVLDLTNLTTSKMEDAFNYLDENIWLDRQTRYLSISLVLYNANFNLFIVCNFQFELSLAGVFIPKYNLQTVKMDLFRSFADRTAEKIKIIVEGICYLGMLYYLINEFAEVYAIYSATGSVRKYFMDVWNLIDWSLISLSFGALAMRIAFVLTPNVANFDPFNPDYVELTAAANMFNSSFAFDAIAATFGVIKIFRFFDLQRNLLILRKSVSRGIGDLVIFTLMLLIIIVGFSFSAMNIFGQENDDFVKLESSFVSLFLTVLGEFDFDKMLRVNLIFAYVFFFFYQFFVFLVMINIFLAILNDAYLAIKQKFDQEELEEVAEALTMRQRVQKLRAWLRQRKLDQRIEFLRKQQRQRELSDRRAQRKVEEARNRTLKAMGVDPNAAAKKGTDTRGGGGGHSSAVLRIETL
jgi:hypothetical protein